MPIKPENKARYPKDWKAIRARILARAGHKCERCEVPNYAWRWNAGCAEHPDGHYSMDEDEAHALSDGKPTRIVLTIGHLDHTPENCADNNLRAWCQRCHLAYDQKHHNQTAHETRRSRKALGDLFA